MGKVKPVKGGRRKALKPPSWYRQSGAIPVRWKNGEPQVLLVTSNGGRRWIIPKGIVTERLAPAASAAKEAWEEAGVTGVVSRRMLGRYTYGKWGGTCTVLVYFLSVLDTHHVWPEERVRQRRWFSPKKAAARVAEPALVAMILAIAKMTVSKTGTITVRR